MESKESQEEPRYIDPVIRAYMKDVDRTMLRANLRLTPEQRINNLQRAVASLFNIRKAMSQAKRR